jgi:hypothetical protein
MSEGKDSIDLSGLAAAVPNAAGPTASLSIPAPAVLLLLGCAISDWFRCRAQRGGQGQPRGVDQGEVSVAVSFLVCWFLTGLWRFSGRFWESSDESMLIRCCAFSEHAAGIGVAAYGRAREPRAQGQEARREAQGDTGIR